METLLVTKEDYETLKRLMESVIDWLFKMSAEKGGPVSNMIQALRLMDRLGHEQKGEVPMDQPALPLQGVGPFERRTARGVPVERKRAPADAWRAAAGVSGKDDRYQNG